MSVRTIRFFKRTSVWGSFHTVSSCLANSLKLLRFCPRLLPSFQLVLLDANLHFAHVLEGLIPAPL